MTVLQPLSESLPFDLALFYDGCFYRLQVKRAQRISDTTYTVPVRSIAPTTKGCKVTTYTDIHTDFMVGVVMPTSDLYFFPVAESMKYSSGIYVCPSSKTLARSKIDTEKYRNVIHIKGAVLSIGE